MIGAGSNILIRDNGYEGFLIKLGKNFNKINLYHCDQCVINILLIVNNDCFSGLLNNGQRAYETYALLIQ